MDLYYFPQWQGSGKTNKVSLGCALLKDFFPQLHFTDIPVNHFCSPSKNSINSYDVILSQSQKFRAQLLNDKPDRIFMLAGECSCEIMPVSYLNKLYDNNLAVIWFDAHADLNTPKSSPSKNMHGMPVRALLGEAPKPFQSIIFSKTTPQQIYYLGIRSIDKPEREYIEDNSISFQEDPNKLILIQSLITQGYKKIYIHFDLDVLDPTEYPYTFYPTPGGLSVSHSLEILHALDTNFEIAGMSILENIAVQNENLKAITPILHFFEELIN